MAIRNKEAILEESMYKKGAEKEFYKYAALLVSTYDENYMRSQKAQIEDTIALLKSRIEEKDFNGTKDAINSEINRLKGKLKMFNYILY